MNEKRKGIWKAVVLTVLFMSAQVLLKEDGKVFAVWWLTILVLGWCSFPLCQYLFSGFRDNPIVIRMFKGIRPAVVALIAIPMLDMAKKANKTWWAWLITVAAMIPVAFMGISPIYILMSVIIISLAVSFWAENRNKEDRP